MKRHRNLPKPGYFQQIPRELLKWEGINTCSTTNAYNPPDLRVKIPRETLMREGINILGAKNTYNPPVKIPLVEKKEIVMSVKLPPPVLTKAKSSVRKCVACQKSYSYESTGHLRLIDSAGVQRYFCSDICLLGWLQKGVAK